ncbi:MAG: peptidoglycan bridge formation glycyltransferase FemA/FemB family protein [Candidatus Saccharibacteria bacterium]|nr:peptidoglycan bridge formation glycyltransferase FemA/FemB family protein [Candidatus Saccharibacteria bacterium]
MRIIDAEDRVEWDEFVTSHKEANFLQSWDFYEFHKSRGEEVIRRLVIADLEDIDDISELDLKRRKKGEEFIKRPARRTKKPYKIVAAYAGEVEHAKRGRHLAIAGGPILDWGDKKVVSAVFSDIREQTKKLNCVFARVRPQCEDTPENREIFAENGLRKAPMYLSVEFAGVLDITKSEEEIMTGMRQRLRRALRKGAKNDIKIEKSTDPKDIHKFYEIQLETAKRHDFYAFSEDFLTKQFKAFAENDEAVLYTAKKDGKILAQNFMIFYGNEASYHYGVSSELGTKLSGAPLLHMEAMRDARKRGIGRYNLWGIVGEEETKHRFYGVSVFKRGFGVEELHYLNARDLVVKPIPYYLKTYIIETIRRKVRHV